MTHPNLKLLQATAVLVRPLLPQLVFVGGCTTALLITDEGAADVRTSYDVDAIAEITSYSGYIVFSGRLKQLGFTEDSSEGAPVCRWRRKEVVLDVMPLDEQLLGFSNRWYKPAMDFAREHEIQAGLRVRAVTAVYFCATKLEAFAGRGKQDYLSSHDLEDLIAVVDGRSVLIDEIEQAPSDVRSYISSEVRKLLQINAFMDALPGYLLPDAASQGRLVNLIARLERIASFV